MGNRAPAGAGAQGGSGGLRSNPPNEGDTDDEKAKSLVRAMLEAGLAERL